MKTLMQELGVLIVTFVLGLALIFSYDLGKHEADEWYAKTPSYERLVLDSFARCAEGHSQFIVQGTNESLDAFYKRWAPGSCILFKPDWQEFSQRYIMSIENVGGSDVVGGSFIWTGK